MLVGVAVGFELARVLDEGGSGAGSDKKTELED
jgi:hypothetical protein